MDLTIQTYGGGEVLQQVFNAIAMLFNGHSNGIVRPLLILCASIGGFWALAKALFSPSLESILFKFIFPVLAISSFLLVPTTSVKIEDVLKDRSYKVDHVPYLLGRFAEIVSSIGYRLTVAIEAVMHTPNDITYNATGMIFGGETALDMRQYQLTNATLEQNLRRFSKQCVLYDIALGRYSVDDLKKASDLWAFFEEKTSSVRMINYCPPNGNGKCTYENCRQALALMKPYFEKEKSYYAKSDILGNLPLAFQALTGLTREKEELIGQQLVMNLLSREYGGSHLAKQRTQAYEQSMLQTLGALAGSKLISVRGVMEALIYIAFVFIVPLSLLPNGLKILSNWASLLVWIQLWPPLYAVINYIIHVNALGHVDTIFMGLNESQRGLNFFTNAGLQHLHHNMMASSGYLYTLVPIISLFLLKGGMQAFSNIAGSLMTSLQNAAANVANEQSTGNYSFANASFGQVSYQNATGFQSNLAPSLASGYFTDHQGSSTVTYSSGENILKQNNSDLRTSLFTDSSLSESVQRSQQHAESVLESKQQTYLESIAMHSKTAADLAEHLSHAENYSLGVSNREGHHIQESASFLQNMAENWGSQYGLNSKESLEGLVSASVGGEVGFFKWFSASGRASTSYGLGASRDEMFNSAQSIAHSESFQKNLQHLQEFAESKNYNELQDEGIRFAMNYSHAVDDLHSSQYSHQVAQSHLDQISDNSSWLNQNSHMIKQSLNQDFVNWAQAKFAEQGGFSRVEEIFSQGTEADKQGLANEFISDLRNNKTQARILEEDKHLSVEKIDFSGAVNWLSESTQDLIKQGVKSNLIKSSVSDEKESLSQSLSKQKEDYQEKIAQVSSKLSDQREESSGQFDGRNEDSLITRAKSQFWHKSNLSNNYKISEEPFWFKREDE